MSKSKKIIPLLQKFIRNTAFHWLISSFLYEISNRLEELEENSIRVVKRFAFFSVSSSYEE